ncbi:MAG: hypothetical protein IKB61_02725 [Elusimicrobiaceae bacterium]|nr:hypothetical protein [Elusimicrobiaceae bacterium]
MEWLTNAVAWLKAHWTDILTIWTCIIGSAEVIVKWTDSKKDDAIFGKIRAIGVKIISWLTKLWFEQPKEK